MYNAINKVCVRIFRYCNETHCKPPRFKRFLNPWSFFCVYIKLYMITRFDNAVYFREVQPSSGRFYKSHRVTILYCRVSPSCSRHWKLDLLYLKGQPATSHALVMPPEEYYNFFFHSNDLEINSEIKENIPIGNLCVAITWWYWCIVRSYYVMILMYCA